MDGHSAGGVQDNMRSDTHSWCRALGAPYMIRDRHRTTEYALNVFMAPVARGRTAATARQPEQGCTSRDLRRERHPDLRHQSALCARFANWTDGSNL